MKAEEAAQISEKESLKAEEQKIAELKVEGEVLLTLEARQKEGEEGEFTTES